MLMDNILGAAVSGWDGKDQQAGGPMGCCRSARQLGFPLELYFFG